jgi:hypothetical protein
VTLVEVLYVDGCPGSQQLLPLVRRLSEERGARLLQRRIETAHDAEAQRFLGSPSVRVNGFDAEPGAAGRTDFGLKCRLYRTVEGCCSQVPDQRWLRDAIEHARP